MSDSFNTTMAPLKYQKRKYNTSALECIPHTKKATVINQVLKTDTTQHFEQIENSDLNEILDTELQSQHGPGQNVHMNSTFF